MRTRSLLFQVWVLRDRTRVLRLTMRCGRTIKLRAGVVGDGEYLKAWNFLNDEKTYSPILPIDHSCNQGSP